MQHTYRWRTATTRGLGCLSQTCTPAPWGTEVFCFGLVISRTLLGCTSYLEDAAGGAPHQRPLESRSHAAMNYFTDVHRNAGRWEYWRHEEPGFCMLMANHTVVEQPTQMQNITSELTRHAVDFITETSNRAQPWFYLMSYIHVHSPIFTSPAFTGVSAGGRFGDTVEELDDSVGQILQALSDAGVADNTFVLFTSDNGPFAEEGYDTCGRTGGLKGSKGQTYEGGVRVPGIAMWPGKIPAGTVSDELISTLDIFPTVIAAVGISSSSSSFSSSSVPVGLDGVNALPLLLDPKNEKSAHTFFWHYCGKNVTAARHQGLKFHFATQIWGTDAKPSPKCTECCPDGPTSFNGTGGSLCDCGSGDLVLHNPPLVFNMTSDRTESNPLTPAEVPDLAARVAAVKAALVLHYAGVQPVKDQMHTLPDIALKPCCTAAGGGNVTPGPFTKCFCRDYTPGKSYP